MRKRNVWFGALLLGAALALLTAGVAEALPLCSTACTFTKCSNACADDGGCAHVSTNCFSGGCTFQCTNGAVYTAPCFPKCGGDGSPIFRKPPPPVVDPGADDTGSADEAEAEEAEAEEAE